MSRGLTAGQIANIEQTTQRVEELLEFYMPGSSNFYFTTGQYAVTVTTATAGSQSFTPNSFISQIGNITESFQAQPNSLDIQKTQGTSPDTFATKLVESAIGSRVVMYKLFRDTTTQQADTTNGVIQVFDGSISGIDFEQSLESLTYTIRCTSDFGDYDKVRGRTTASIPGALSSQRLYWGSFYLE